MTALLLLGCGGSENADDQVTLEDVDVESTARETTTTRESTTTTEPRIEDPSEVVGLAVAEAVTALSRSGLDVEQIEVIDEDAEDGEVLSATPQPDGSVALTVARPPVTRFLERQQSVAGDNPSGPPFNVNGTTYTHGVSIVTCEGTEVLEYDLGRDFRLFRATTGLLDESPSDLRFRLEITVDGAIVATSDLGLGEAVPVELDVTDALRIRIAVNYLSGGDRNCEGLGLGDAALIGVPSEVPPEPE